MKMLTALACAALAAAAAFGQNAPPKPAPELNEVQGIPASPLPSSLPPTTPSTYVPPKLPPGVPLTVFNKPPPTATPDRTMLPSTAAKIIVNYWDAVRDMMRRIQNAPPRPSWAGIPSGELRPDYPFEEFRNLRGIDLIRAAKEGALAARRQKADRPAAEIDRQARENTALALEYFPLVVRDEADIQSIARIIESREEDLELRRFVLEKLAPDQKAPSLLSMFLDDAYARHPAEFNKVLDAASGHPMETPSFQVEAMRVYHGRLMRRYRDTFAADPKSAARAKETGQPEAPAVLVGENPPEIEKVTREKLEGLGSVISGFAALIAAHIDPDSARDESVKAETRRILGEIAAEVLVPDRERILRFLDPSRPAPPAGEQFPAMPDMPDSGGEELLMPALPGAEIGLPIGPQVSQGDQPPPTPVPLPSGL